MPELTAALEGSSVIDFEFQEDLTNYLDGNGNPPVHSLAEIVDKGLFHSALEAGFRRRLLSKGRNSDEYQKALAKRTALVQAMLKLMDDQKVDALLYPTMKRPPARIGDGQGGSNCQLSPSTGFPAISMQAGFTPDGLPVGVELFGRPFDDAKLVSYAYAYERAANHRRAPALTPALGVTRSPALMTWQSSAPAAGTPGRVSAKFSFDPATNELKYSVAATGFKDGEILSATIHRVAKDENGPAIFILSHNAFENLAGAEKLSSPDREKLLAGGLYLRVATRSNSGSGIRIPLRPNNPR